MPNWIQLVRIAKILLPGCVTLVLLAGCGSLQNTSFAPLTAKLEPAPDGKVEYLVVINTSGQTLHNLRFSGDIQNNHNFSYPDNGITLSLPNHSPATTYIFQDPGSTLEPGKAIRFRTNFGLGVEGAIIYPVSIVRVAGSCDEGRFRESWQIAWPTNHKRL